MRNSFMGNCNLAIPQPSIVDRPPCPSCRMAFMELMEHYNWESDDLRVPIVVGYEFRCEKCGHRGARMSILEWEVAQAKLEGG